MRYTVLSLFPEITDAFFATSIMAKAIARGIVGYRSVDIRDFALDKHRTCDDTPYGGGPGMLMLAEPLGRALEAVGVQRKIGSAAPDGESAALRRRVIFLSPSGRPLTQELARELAGYDELVLVCGRYEGIDQRVVDLYVDEEVSVGDYVLSSGEVAALAVADATYRLIDDVIRRESLDVESFSRGLLEYPQYTRPEVYGTMGVPEVLLSGHHENVRRWRLERQVERTLARRPDMILQGRESGLFDAETERIIERLFPSPGNGTQGDEDERD